MENFQRIKVIGKGSYGEVWLAKHQRDKKQYVLKKMDLQKASKRERKAAEQEAKLLSKLKHPNIVGYKDSFETDDGYLWIAMGFCEGGDLYNALKQCKGSFLDERQIIEWFVQISMALQYLHERNILHRDLKTQNIFLTKSKIIKLGDLGIARVLDSSNDMATTLIGTPYYMSPELFSNKPYNHKSDVWALGCCVYEMATLKHAFNAKDMNSLVYKILRGKMPPMPGQYSSDLNNLIRAMLDQNPARRPSVNKILRDPFIKKNIAIFLEGTRRSRAAAPLTSARQPQKSAVNARGDAGSSIGSSSETERNGDRRSAGRRKPRPGSGDSRSRDVFANPLPVNKPRPLPKAPISAPATPVDPAPSPFGAQDELDEGQRTNPNMSARARRRERSMRDETPRASYDGIQKIHLEPKRRGGSANSDRPDSAKSAGREGASTPSKTVTIDKPAEHKHHHRQPSLASIASTANDDDDENVDTEERERQRGERELDNLERVLDATLHINAASQDDEDEDEDDDDDDIEMAAKPSHPEIGQPPAFSAETLNSSGRLMGRIVALRKDCLHNVGLEKLHRAFQILEDTDGDAMESKLKTLLGDQMFEEYAGKIWQLKFCEESAFKPGM